MTLEVIKPGLKTTVQDLGRPGYYQLGIPMGGAMDRLALRAANALVGNEEGAAGLEAAYLGPELRFGADCVFAATGADAPVLLDGEAQPGWTALAAR
ncbi:MAG: allophanate hydrolase, partial [Gammaproteobacteria bacterium]